MPRLVYFVPLSALFIAALSLFFSPSDELTFARLIGGPTDQSPLFRGRVQLLKEREGIAEPVPSAQAIVIAEQGGNIVRRAVRVGADGWAEIELPRYPEQDLNLTILDPGGAILAKGRPALGLMPWLDSAQKRVYSYRYHTQHSIAACVQFPGLILAVPFEGELEVQVRSFVVDERCSAETGEPLANAEVSIQLDGGENLSLPTCLTDAAGICRYRIRPQHHGAKVQISVGSAGQEFKWEESLPVVAGAFGLERRQSGSAPDRFLIRSPVTRDRVWYSLVNAEGRGPGGVVSLLPTGDGTAEGELKLSKEQQRDSFLVLASDADGRSTSSVGYPLSGQSHSLDVWDAYLLDGGPRARNQLKQRVLRVRYALGGYSLVAIVLTLILLWRGVRDEQREGDQRLLAAGFEGQSQRYGSLPLVLAVLCVFFAFSLTLVWIVAR